ncbi:MAG: hypothetical protein PHU80_00710 [Kiritimatiellae bacterium]|nr:hypothetical protein [Kiritimatiellia bacterium]
MLKDGGHKIMLLLAAFMAVVAALAMYGFAVWFGNLNQDEGWYLYAARMVAAGKQPYRDFFFTQGPVMPFVYGLFYNIWSGGGVLGGRVLTAFLGLAGCCCAAGLARRAVPSQRAAEAAVMAFALTACNLYHVYFTSIPKTYALASCLLLGGYWLLTLCLARHKRTRSHMSCMWALPAGLLVALAAGTRLSMGALLPVTVLALAFTWRRTGAAFFWFALGGFLGLVLVYGPALLFMREQFIFSQTFHTARGGHDPMLIVGSLSRTMRAYMPAFMLLAGYLVFHLWPVCKGRRKALLTEAGGIEHRGGLWPGVWMAGFSAVFLAQMCSPYPYDDYHVPLMGLLAAALAGWMVNSVASRVRRGQVCLVVVFFSLAASFASPLLQEWFVIRQDRFWTVRRKVPDLVLLRSVARDVRALSGADRMLFTQDTYLAVEAGMSVPSGLEMGPFAYFPALNDAEAAKHHVMNKSRMIELLGAAPSAVAAYSGYGFSINSPVMDEVAFEDRQLFLSLLGKSYDFVQEVPAFGQNSTTLQILARRRVLGSED